MLTAFFGVLFWYWKVEVGRTEKCPRLYSRQDETATRADATQGPGLAARAATGLDAGGKYHQIET